jgi:lysophospholipase L1-like esterase
MSESDWMDSHRWSDVLELGVKGLAWRDEARIGPFDRFPSFLKIVAAGHPTTPTLLVPERLFADAAFMPQRGEDCTAKNQIMRKIVEDRRKAGQSNLHIIDMCDYYGENGSTDSNHPNDLGAERLFQRLLPVVRSHL